MVRKPTKHAPKGFEEGGQFIGKAFVGTPLVLALMKLLREDKPPAKPVMRAPSVSSRGSVVSMRRGSKAVAKFAPAKKAPAKAVKKAAPAKKATPAAPKPPRTPAKKAPAKPTARADLTQDRDTLRALLADLPAAPRRGDDRQVSDDPVLHRIADRRGWTGHPRRVDTATFDRMLAAGQPEMWRGVESQEEADSLVGGDLYYGGSDLMGLLGGGIPTASDRPNARQYGDVLTRMTLAPGSRVIDIEDLEDEFEAWKADFGPGERLSPEDRLLVGRDGFGDLSRFAAARGYDAVRVQGDQVSFDPDEDPEWLDVIAGQYGLDDASQLTERDIEGLRNMKGLEWAVLNRSALVVDVESSDLSPSVKKPDAPVRKAAKATPSAGAVSKVAGARPAKAAVKVAKPLESYSVGVDPLAVKLMGAGVTSGEHRIRLEQLQSTEEREKYLTAIVPKKADLQHLAREVGYDYKPGDTVARLRAGILRHLDAGPGVGSPAVAKMTGAPAVAKITPGPAATKVARRGPATGEAALSAAAVRHGGTGSAERGLHWRGSRPSALSAEELQAGEMALLAYRRPAGLSWASYADVNARLRGIPDPHAPVGLSDAGAQRAARRIDAIMEHAPLSRDVEVWRTTPAGAAIFGGRLDGDLTGFTWEEKAYLSTTAHPDFQFYGGVPGAVKMRILAPRGTHGIQMSDWRVGDEDDEAELLLERGLTLRVTADRGVDSVGTRLLDVEVVPSSPAATKVAKAAAAKKAPFDAVEKAERIASLPRTATTAEITAVLADVRTVADLRKVARELNVGLPVDFENTPAGTIEHPRKLTADQLRQHIVAAIVRDRSRFTWR